MGLKEAQELDAHGFNVFPAAYKGKIPLVKWRQYQHVRVSEHLGLWFKDEVDRNYWIMTGRISNTVVLDSDSDLGEAHWRALIGEQMDRTACAKTAKGYHFYFSIESDDAVASWSHHDEATGLSWDVRADGAGVIAPPSIHESGVQYEWVRGPEHMLPLPQELRGPQSATGGHGEGKGATRSLLAKLLADPPDEGGRNVWMSRVAGHYAKAYRDQADAYRVQCEIANQLLSPPLDPAEFEKCTNSIWESEHAKSTEQLQHADENNGYLLSGGDVILAPVKVKVEDEITIQLRQWANFDIRALGVVEGEEVARIYDVELHRKRQGDVIEDLLPASAIADGRRMAAWFAEHGCVLTAPTEPELSKMRPTDRMLAYLESQDPPSFKVVPALGWDDDSDGFVTHEGVIRADGLHGFAGAKPNPLLRKQGVWRYGFAEVDEARRVLNEVLTFHHSEVASVFGSWWAACFLKPQLQAVSSQFPLMSLEAPSESGKTTGMFSKLIQLSGNAQGQTLYTYAALRDALGTHHSGIVWIDDEDNVEHLTRLFRGATGEGSLTKKGEDRTESVTAHLVAPLLVSGEALQMGEQKALRDRSIQLEVTPPTNRRSLRNPGRPQWDDIVELTAEYPDLTVMAGTMVQLALQQVGRVAEMRELRGAAGKRFGDKIGVLRVGARILAGMTGDPSHVDVVDRWVDDQEDTGSENTLTLKLLPKVLALLGWPDHVDGPDRGLPATPVFVRPDSDKLGGVWFSPSHLALWWDKYNNGRIEQRTESQSAIEQQARAMGLPERTSRIRITGDPNNRPTYWQLPDDIGKQVVARSRGESVEDEGRLL